MTTVLITGSEGHIGRALVKAYERDGCDVSTMDVFGTPNYRIDLEMDNIAINAKWDIVICNAKVSNWRIHNVLASKALRSVVNIGSIYGAIGNDPKMYEETEIEPTPAAYAASKGALIALTKWQATNLAPARSNCVCPGGIYRGHSDLFRRRYEARVPLGRMATEEDVVNAVMFLSSERSSYITGQVLMVDGGYSAL